MSKGQTINETPAHYRNLMLFKDMTYYSYL